MRITLKITLAITLLTSVVMVSMGVLGVRRETRLMEAELQRDTRIVAESLASSLDGGNLTPERIAQLDRSLSGLARSEPGVVVDFLRPDELDSLALGEALRGRPRSAGPHEYRTRDHLYAVAPLFSGGALAGAVRVSESLDVPDHFAARALKSTAGSILLIVTLSALLAALLGRTLVGQRVDDLVQGARKVAGGDLTQRLDARGDDELGLLMHEVNNMTEQLERARSGELAEAERRRGAELQLRHAQRLATVGQLAAGLAHELGTPLNVISGRAALIQSRAPEAGRDAAVIVEQAHRVTDLVHQLLGFARREEPVRRSCDGREAAEHVLDLLGAQARARGVALELRAPDSEIALQADPTQLEQILTNLVRNAIQASDGGGAVVLSLAEQPREEEPGAAFSVIDHGAGVPRELQERVFDPFFTTKEPGKGTGLGLSVVLGIVRDHAGTVELSETPGGGATFTVWLPRLRGDAPVRQAV